MLMSHEKKLVQAPEQVTPEFKIFMRDILRYRCLLSEKVYNRCFNNEKSWYILHRAFIHKSVRDLSLELLEFHGDVVLNLSVVEYVRDDFPDVTSVDWNSGLKINFVAGHFLSKTAIKYGFWKHIVFSQELLDFFNYQEDPMEHEEFFKSNEDVFEAVCGAITGILNSYMTKGVGYNACFNMVKSYLDVSDEVILFKRLWKEKKYQELYDNLINAKTRLKETFDQEKRDRKWGDKSCSINENLKIFNISDAPIGKMPPKRDLAMRIYMESVENGGIKLDPLILTNATKKKFLALGYTCDISGHLYTRKLVSAKISNDKTSCQIAAAQEVIEDLKKKGMFKPHTNPFR